MSGKFMEVKRIIIPTITLVLIASQLMGCAAASQDELLSMIDAGDSIEIEVAAPAFAEAEQGEESSLLWEQLALLSTNPAMRKAWDSTLGITNTDTGKNGMLYVGVDGKNENNNTLRVALHNREFQKALENDSTVKKLAESAMENYTDLDTDEESKALLMGINGYFNILPDNIPSYCNADSTVTRAEFMSAIMRAETAVSDEYEAPKSFSDSVGGSDYNDYAYVLEESSYLKTSNKSLNNQTYNGSISRAEAVYMVVNRYFSEDLKNVDVTKVTFEDAKDGGDIATVQGYAGKDYSTNYEIVYSIQNPDKGLPTNLYKALAVAKEKGLIGNETRWDEAITRSEVIELLISAYEKETGVSDFNAKQGTTMLVYETGKSEGVKEEYTETEMDAVMQAITEAYTYAGPSASAYEKIGAVQKDEVIQVVSKVDGYNWYKIVQEGDIEAYVDGEYLKVYEEQPIEEEAPAPTVEEETPVVKEETPVVKEEVPEVKEETPVQQPVEQPATSTSTPSQPETPAVQPSTPSSSSGATTSNDSSSTGWIGKPQAVGETGADGSTYMGELNHNDFMNDNW